MVHPRKLSVQSPWLKKIISATYLPCVSSPGEEMFLDVSRMNVQVSNPIIVQVSLFSHLSTGLSDSEYFDKLRILRITVREL